MKWGTRFTSAGIALLAGAAAVMAFDGPIRYRSTIWGDTENLELGRSVAFIGDWDGDGLDDFAVGAPGEGKVFLFRGRESLELSSWTSGDAAATLRATDADGRFGQAIVNVGDVTGDGLPDLAVAAHEEGPGKVYVFSGAAGLVDRDAADADAIVSGVRPKAHFGFAISLEGDANGDGTADLLVGAPGERLGPRGRAALFLGPLAPAATIDDADAVYTTDRDAERLGYSVTLLDDMDGDGIGEIGLGGPTGEPTVNPRIALFFGAASPPGGDVSGADFVDERLGEHGPCFGFAMGPGRDLNGDSFDEWRVAGGALDAPRDTKQLRTCRKSAGGGGEGGVYERGNLLGFTAFAFGRFTGDFMAVGDVDADGRGDWLALQIDRDDWFAGLSHSCDVLNSGGGIGHCISPALFHPPGISIASGGDLNGDGLDDVLIGSIEGESNYGLGAGTVEIWTPVPDSERIGQDLSEVLERIQEVHDEVREVQTTVTDDHEEIRDRLDGLEDDLDGIGADLDLLVDAVARLEAELALLRDQQAKARRERVEEDLFENRMMRYLYTPEAEGGALELAFRIVDGTIEEAAMLGIDPGNAADSMERALAAVAIAAPGDPVAVSADLDYKRAARGLAAAYRRVVLGRAR